MNTQMNTQINELRTELNNNIALAGTTAVKAIEQNEDTRRVIDKQAKEENNKLTEFFNEFDTRASQFQNEITGLSQENKKLFDMIQSVAGTALTSKDLQEVATLKNIDDINKRIVDYYSKLENTRNTIISLTKESSQEQTNAILTLCGNLEKGLNQHQKKFEYFLKNLHIDYNKALESIKDITVKAIADTKLPEKLALTTNLDPNTNKAFKEILENISNLASQFTVSLQAFQQQMEKYKSYHTGTNEDILKTLALCNDTIKIRIYYLLFNFIISLFIIICVII